MGGGGGGGAGGHPNYPPIDPAQWLPPSYLLNNNSQISAPIISVKTRVWRCRNHKKGK